MCSQRDGMLTVGFAQLSRRVPIHSVEVLSDYQVTVTIILELNCDGGDAWSYVVSAVPVQSALQCTKPDPSSALDMLRSTLSQYYKITIQDGRYFIGSFACIDRDKNMILTNTEEYRTFRPGEPPKARFVGMVMIPWKWVVKAEVELD